MYEISENDHGRTAHDMSWNLPICDRNFIYKGEVAGPVVKRGYITMVEMSV